MSDLMSAISYDIEEYERRCKKFKQKVQYTTTKQGCSLPDCYGKHAEKLKMLEDNKRKRSSK